MAFKTRFYNWDLIYLPEAIRARENTSKVIKQFMLNNTALLREAGLTVLKMVRDYERETKIKLNVDTLSRLKCGRYQSCNLTLLMYICQYWGVSFDVMMDKNFDAKAVYESLSVKPVKGKNH